MFEQGIIPMEKIDSDMRRVLAQLPADEARTLRRKFRKLWRRAVKQLTAGMTDKLARPIKAVHGLGKNTPSRAEQHARKQLVFNVLWKEHIEPMIRNFENPPHTQT
jgi:hypothetical protein